MSFLGPFQANALNIEKGNTWEPDNIIETLLLFLELSHYAWKDI